MTSHCAPLPPINALTGPLLPSPIWAITAPSDFCETTANRWGCAYVFATTASFDALLFDKSRVMYARTFAPCGGTFYRLDWKTGSHVIQAAAAGGLSVLCQTLNVPILTHYHIEGRWVLACGGNGSGTSSRRVIRIPAQWTAEDSHIERVSNNRILVTCGSGEDRIVFVVHDTVANTVV